MSTAPETRITRRFAALKEEGRAGLVAFVTAADPNRELGQKILDGLPAAGADVIELGMSFTDPMADGPPIQAASLRALAAGNTLQMTLDMVADFRKKDTDTPIVLMGYYNPIYSYGVDAFLTAAKDAGVDGLIIVDLPPEEDEELCLPAIDAGINFIRLATPTTDDARLPQVIKNTSGFLYYVSVAGITGAQAPDNDTVKAELTRIRKSTDMPIAVGFGIKSAEQAAAIGSFADAAVVGSALVEAVRQGLDDQGQGTQASVDNVLRLVADLAQGVQNARK